MRSDERAGVGGSECPVTCEDRDYRCCEMVPPVVGLSDGEVTADLTAVEYDEWYDRHVAAWEATR